MTNKLSRKPGRPAIPLSRIVDTALEIIDEHGADALSLRVLADRLGSSTSTLYRHVSGRSELIGLVVDRMLGDAGELAGDVSSAPWPEACRRIATAMYSVLSRHGSAAALLTDTVPTGPSAMALRERLLAVLLADGFAPERALRTVATLGHYVIGFAIQTPRTPHEWDASAYGVRVADYPMTASVAQYMPRPISEEFSFGLELILAGLGTAPHPKGP